MKLYKFRDWNSCNTKKILKDQKLWFAAVETLNDPMDCRDDARVGYEALLADLQKRYPPHIHTNQQCALNTRITFRYPNGDIEREIEFNDYVDELLRQIGVLSFSLTATDPLMWSHYADGHRGICFEFDSWALWGGNNELQRIDVKYRSEPPFVTLRNEVLDLLASRGSATPFGHEPERRAKRFVDAAVTTKSMSWVYEQEHRIIRAVQGGLSFDPRALTRVIFGTRTHPKTRQDVLNQLAANGFSHAKEARVEPQVNTFEFKLLRD